MRLRCFIFSIIVMIGCLGAFFSCSDLVPTKEVYLIDSLNASSYNYRYKDIDSSYAYALKAIRQVNFYRSGKAEAYNNLGFCSFMKMDFEKAEKYYKMVNSFARNELELLIADIGLMRICQRTAMNQEFYDYRNRALSRMRRINEDKDLFIDRHEQLRLNYAYSEFYIVTAIYYYYLQQRFQALHSLNQVNVELLQKDDNQWLYYHYVKGAAGLYSLKDIDLRRLKIFDDLFSAWQQAKEKGAIYFEANCMQAIANLMPFKSDYLFFKERRLHQLQRLGGDIDETLPLQLARRALIQLQAYKDSYQTVGGYVTIARLLNNHGCYQQALDSLENALDYVNSHHLLHYNDTIQLVPYPEQEGQESTIEWNEDLKIKTVPEWISRIREQISVAYAGLGFKEASDYNRNRYLDILNFTRQDKELENRYLTLEKQSSQLSWLLIIVILGLFFLALFFFFFSTYSKKRSELYLQRLQQILMLSKEIISSIPMDVVYLQKRIDKLFGEHVVQLVITDEHKAVLKRLKRQSKENDALLSLLQPYLDWALENEQMAGSLSYEQELIEKQHYIYQKHIADNKRENITKKACLSVVNGLNPYIDRILNEVHKLIDRGYINQQKIKEEKLTYIGELVDQINEYNEVLAFWIKVKQGTLNLNIESFDLNDLFLLLNKSRRTFEVKNQQLVVEPTAACVKADKALTLFMINTLAENARKYTPQGGVIKIYAHEEERYVEISIEDNGIGLSDEDIHHIVGEKVYDSSKIGLSSDAKEDDLKLQKGSGFGLMNCKGIIEKYRKTNSLFEVCTFNIESKLGEGSRFYFRLPKGMKRLFTILSILFLPLSFMACNGDISSLPEEQYNILPLSEDPNYNRLLNEASDYANMAYFSNIDKDYRGALQYADSAMICLNEHYELYSNSTEKNHYLTQVGEGMPAEIYWWNHGYQSDYHVIMDIRNESAVAFLALKDIKAYEYNNTAFTDLYKLQSEDRSLEDYCWELEQSSINKRVSIILCIILLLSYVVIYYFLHMRKRIKHRLSLEQVLEINKKVFLASSYKQEVSKPELDREQILKDIPLNIVRDIFALMDQLLSCSNVGIAIYKEATDTFDYYSYPRRKMPDLVKDCFECEVFLADNENQAIPLVAHVGDEKRKIGVLCLERLILEDSDKILLELISQYVSIVIFNAVIKLANTYQDIENAQDENYKASFEENLLHVQNMVLDNCLSAIKHETIYYPNKIKHTVNRLIDKQAETITKEEELIHDIIELIEYYKGVYLILSSCASRQLEEVTFRRGTIEVSKMLQEAEHYFNRKVKMLSLDVTLECSAAANYLAIGDATLLRFLLENIIDEALNDAGAGKLMLRVTARDSDFISFEFVDARRAYSLKELTNLFYPSLGRMRVDASGKLKGVEYLVCKQIIRDHDEYLGHRGCRINGFLPQGEKGFGIYFTIPKKK